ncbi:MAG: acetylornithine aminotransferase [Isosphaera sp.]|nr:acetylornithine aminotransferase [Isosphaera sp.]
MTPTHVAAAAGTPVGGPPADHQGAHGASAGPGAIAVPGTAGAAMAGSPAVRRAIDMLVAEVAAASAKVTDARGPVSAEGRQRYEQMMAQAAEVRGRALLYPYLGSGVGNGPLVELADGSVKWDMISGIGVHFLGHSDPGLVRAGLEGALTDVVQEGNLQANDDAYQFGRRLVGLARRSSRLAHVYPSTSGAMANENALKVCYQKHAPASRVIAFKDCFMGRSVTMSQIGDSAANRVGVPLSTLVDYMPFYDEAAARRVGATRYIDMCVWHLRQYVERYPGQHACFIFELVQGEGGFNTAPREFFTALIDVCRAHKIAVWDDEIQTFGRTTSMFAYEALGLGEFVDVFCVGKMTQACATMFTPEYNPGPGLLSGTFISGPTQFRAGIEVLGRLAENEAAYYGHDGSFARHHALFVEQVRALAARRPGWFGHSSAWGQLPDIVGGTGGMMKFTPFGGDKDRVTRACRAMFDAGVIAFYCGHGPYHVRMLPPMPAMRPEMWPKVFRCVEEGLAAVAG